MSGFFVTGTDTDSGKTFFATALIHALRQQGAIVYPFKPVAAGAELIDGRLYNEDALALIRASGQDLPYELVNPYCFEPPIAPHIAADQAGVRIVRERIRRCYNELATQPDHMVVEGAGGWRVPLDGDWDIAALAADLDLPVILVVGMKLGCLSHALLTVESIQASGLKLAGWIASQTQPDMAVFDENIETLKRSIEAPFLGLLPHQPNIGAEEVASHIAVRKIL